MAPVAFYSNTVCGQKQMKGRIKDLWMGAQPGTDRTPKAGDNGWDLRKESLLNEDKSGEGQCPSQKSKSF